MFFFLLLSYVAAVGDIFSALFFSALTAPSPSRTACDGDFALFIIRIAAANLFLLFFSRRCSCLDEP